MKNRQFDFNFPLYACVFGLLAAFGGASLGAASLALDRLSYSITGGIESQERIAQLQRESFEAQKAIEEQQKVAQSYIDNQTGQYDSIFLRGYVCNPDNPPDPSLLLGLAGRETKLVMDTNKRIIGELLPSGAFYFNPENCK